MPSSSSSSSSSSSRSEDPDYGVSSSDLDDDAAAVVLPRQADAATIVLPRQADAAAIVSVLCTKEEVDGVLNNFGISKEQYTALPAGDLRASSPPPSGAVCVYAHALEAGMRLPLHGFFSEALAHFGIAPSQLTPNGWRIMAGFLLLCHSDGVPASLAVFRHFFVLSVLNLKHKGWYCFRSKNTSALGFTGLPHDIKGWKRGFFFLSSTTPWPCPVEWGEPSKSSFMEPVLTGKEKKWAAKLQRAHGAAPVDLRKCLSNSNLAAAMVSPLSPSCTRTTSASSKGMDPPASAKKVKIEPGSSPLLCRKKRRLDGAIGEDGPSSSVLPNTPPAAHGYTVPTGARSPRPGFARTPTDLASGHVGESPHWQTARKLQEQVRPGCVSLGYALELEEKLGEQEAEIAALRKQLEETDGELAMAKRTWKAAVQELLRSEERVCRRAEHALEGYKRWKKRSGAAQRT